MGLFVCPHFFFNTFLGLDQMSVPGTALHMQTTSSGYTVQQEFFQLNMHKSGVLHIPS